MRSYGPPAVTFSSRRLTWNGKRRNAQLNFWRAQAIDAEEISARRLLEVLGTGK